MNKSVMYLALALFLASCISQPKSIEDGSTNNGIDMESLQSKVISLGVMLHPIVNDLPEKKSIAILSFSGVEAKIASHIQNILYEVIFKIGKLKLIERESLDKILQEQSFQISGIVDDSTAKKVGKIAGIDYICYGSIIDLGTYIRIVGKVVDIESGELVGISSVNVKITDDVAVLLGRQIEKASVKTSVTSKKPVSVINWIIDKKRNEFDSLTVYNIYSNAPETGSILLGYVKNDDPLKSYVRVGIARWNFPGMVPSNPKFDIKMEDGTSKSYILEWISWDEDKGHVKFGYGDYYLYCLNNKQREFFNMIVNNNWLMFRAGEKIQRFNTTGLSSVLSSQGITFSELNAAITNEEF